MGVTGGRLASFWLWHLLCIVRGAAAAAASPSRWQRGALVAAISSATNNAAKMRLLQPNNKLIKSIILPHDLGANTKADFTLLHVCVCVCVC